MVLLAVALLYMFRDLVVVLLTSIVVASAIEPFTKWFMRYRIPRVLAVILVYFVVLVVLFGLILLFVPPLLDDVLRLASTLPQEIEKSEILSEYLSGSFAAERIRDAIIETISLQELFSGAKNAISSVGGGVAATAGRLFGGALSFVLTIVFSFYFSVQEKGIEEFLRLVVPSRHEAYAIDLWKRSQRKIGLWMQGQLLLGLLIGVFVYLGLTILGIKYALTLALLAAVMELIPIFGPILAAVPAVVIGFTQSTTLGLAVLALYIIIQQFENHLIYPLVVRKIVGVPPLVVIIALLVGAQLAGFLGIILSVPFAAALMEYVADVEKRKQAQVESAPV